MASRREKLRQGSGLSRHHSKLDKSTKRCSSLHALGFSRTTIGPRLWKRSKCATQLGLSFLASDPLLLLLQSTFSHALSPLVRVRCPGCHSRPQRANAEQVSVLGADDSALWTSASEPEDAFPFGAGDAYSVVYSRAVEDTLVHKSLAGRTSSAEVAKLSPAPGSRSTHGEPSDPGYSGGCSHVSDDCFITVPSGSSGVSPSFPEPSVNTRAHSLARIFQAQRESLPWLVPPDLDDKEVEAWLRRQLRCQKRREREFRSFRLWQLERKAAVPGLQRPVGEARILPSGNSALPFFPPSYLTEEEEAECRWLREERKKKWERVDKARRQLKVQLLAHDAREQEQIESRLARQYTKLIEKRDRMKDEVELLRVRFPCEDHGRKEQGRDRGCHRRNEGEEVEEETNPPGKAPAASGDVVTGGEAEAVSPEHHGEDTDGGRKVSEDSRLPDPHQRPSDQSHARDSVAAGTGAQKKAVPGPTSAGCQALPDSHTARATQPGSDTSVRGACLTLQQDVPQSALGEKVEQEPPAPGHAANTTEPRGCKQTSDGGQRESELGSTGEAAATCQDEKSAHDNSSESVCGQTSPPNSGVGPKGAPQHRTLQGRVEAPPSCSAQQAQSSPGEGTSPPASTSNAFVSEDAFEEQQLLEVPQQKGGETLGQEPARSEVSPETEAGRRQSDQQADPPHAVRANVVCNSISSGSAPEETWPGSAEEDTQNRAAQEDLLAQSQRLRLQLGTQRLQQQILQQQIQQFLRLRPLGNQQLRAHQLLLGQLSPQAIQNSASVQVLLLHQHMRQNAIAQQQKQQPR